MQLSRRALLGGISTTALAVFMPWPASSVPLDHGALELVATFVRRTLMTYNLSDCEYLFRYALKKEFADHKDEWLSEKHVVAAVDRTLRLAFRSLQVAANNSEYSFPLMQDGKLTVYGLNAICYLPLSPYDYDKSLFVALNRLAPHYLT
jgi:hypothetical protein